MTSVWIFILAGHVLGVVSATHAATWVVHRAAFAPRGEVLTLAPRLHASEGNACRRRDRDSRKRELRFSLLAMLRNDLRGCRELAKRDLSERGRWARAKTGFARVLDLLVNG